MKTIGMLGGMSWESTAGYYRILNEEVKKRLGGLHSAKILLNSVDFHEIEKLQVGGKWGEAGEILINASESVEAGGADFLIICTNTMHKVYEMIEKSLSIPLIHIADATGKKLAEKNIKSIGLLGTGFTMEEDFYKDRIESKYAIDVMIPEKKDRDIVHNVIYSELCLGRVNKESREEYLRIINGLADKGSEGVILGCTEIGLLVNQDLTDVPLFDTTNIHALEAVDYALKD